MSNVQTRMILIGTQGEAEINPAWSPEEAMTHLDAVSQACGYVTTYREHLPHHTVIEHINENGRFYLTYWHGVLDTIDQITYRRFWTKGE